MDPTEALRHLRVMLRAAAGVEDAAALRKAIVEMRALVDKALAK